MRCFALNYATLHWIILKQRDSFIRIHTWNQTASHGITLNNTAWHCSDGIDPSRMLQNLLAIAHGNLRSTTQSCRIPQKPIASRGILPECYSKTCKGGGSRRNLQRSPADSQHNSSTSLHDQNSADPHSVRMGYYGHTCPFPPFLAPSRYFPQLCCPSPPFHIFHSPPIMLTSNTQYPSRDT